MSSDAHLLIFRKEANLTKETLEKIEQKAQSICSELNLQLYSLSLKYLEDGNVLTIELDKHFSISMEDIEKFSNIMNTYLDSIENEIPEEYSLEVCSPGIFRKVEFKDFEYIQNYYLNVKLESGEIKGQLISFTPTSFTLKINNKGRIKNHTILNKDVIEMHLDVK